MADGDVIEIGGANTAGVDRSEDDLTVRVLAAGSIRTAAPVGWAIWLDGEGAEVEIDGLLETSPLRFTERTIIVRVGDNSHVHIGATGRLSTIKEPTLAIAYDVVGVGLEEGSTLHNEGVISGVDYGVTGGSVINDGEIIAYNSGARGFVSFTNNGRVVIGEVQSNPLGGTYDGLFAGDRADITNNGELVVATNAPGFSATGIGVAGGTMTNTGSITITAASVYAVRGNDDISTLVNSGTIVGDTTTEANPNGSMIVGFEAYGIAAFINSGLFEMRGTEFAMGVRMWAGGTIVNEADGEIRVSGNGNIVYAIGGGGNGIRAPEGIHITNHGLIEAIHTGGGESVAISVYNDTGASNFHLENTGTIIADTILRNFDRGWSNGQYGPDGRDTVINSGALTGDLFFQFDRDTLTNSGVITGLVDMGVDDDAVANTGTINGALHLGAGNDVLTGAGRIAGGVLGGDGDDRISSAGHGVVIDGGAGADTATFAFARAAAEIVSWRGVLAVGGAGGEGMDRLTSIEQLQFSDQTVNAASLARFDIYGYIAGYDDLMVTYGVHNLDGAVEHFITTGYAQGRDTDQFSGIQYIAGYNDLIMAFGTDEDVAGRHYIQFGVSGGRVRDNFSGADYIASYNDLIMAFGLDEDVAARHYIQFGYSSGRSRDTFDGWQYIASYDDLIVNIGADEAEAARHFVQTGYGQGRARDVYNWLEYIAGHDDLIVAFGADETAGARHYVETGFAAGRARDAFDGLQYIASYADLIQSFGEDEGRGASHYIQFGFNEGRARDTFDAAQYLANYADLQAVFGSDLYNATRHYILYGYYEGRTDNDLTPNGGDDGLAILADKGDSFHVSPLEFDKAGDPAPEVQPDEVDFGALRLALDDGFLMQSFVDTAADLRAKGIVMPPEWAVLLA